MSDYRGRPLKELQPIAQEVIQLLVAKGLNLGEMRAVLTDALDFGIFEFKPSAK